MPSVDLDVDLIQALDDASVRAVPAGEAQDIGGWLVRHTSGLGTRRVNSVLAREHDDGADLDDKLAAVERFYAEREQPARFQITPACQPPELPELLRARGYALESPTLVQRAELEPLAAAPIPPGTTTDVAPHPGPVWWTTWHEAIGIDPARLGAVADLLGRIQQPAAFVTVSVNGAAAAVAMGVLDESWVGIFNMATLPEQRRRGSARTALAALAAWAVAHRATHAYLQVELDNPPAVHLYRGAGFIDVYRYVYLRLPARP